MVSKSSFRLDHFLHKHIRYKVHTSGLPLQIRSAGLKRLETVNSVAQRINIPFYIGSDRLNMSLRKDD